MKKTKLKIALSTILVIFNLVFCFVATYAWFVGFGDSDSSGLGVKMESYDLDIEYYKIFKYDDDAKCGIDVTNFEENFELPFYDTVIRTRNEHTAVILLFCIKGEEIGSTSIMATLTCDEDNVMPYDDDDTDDFMSNGVRFKFAPISTQTIPAIVDPENPTDVEAASIYAGAVEFFENITDESTFINPANQNKSTMITKTITSSQYADFVVDNKLYFYMLFDYSEALIQDLLDTGKIAPGGVFKGDLVNLKLSALAENNPQG